MKETILAVLGAIALSSCASAPPSAGYVQCKQALVDSIAQDIKEGEE